jgi:hypothetical protein
MKEGTSRMLMGNNDVAEKKLMRIHLLVSVQPSNEIQSPINKRERDYDILILNPRLKKSVAIIQHIAVIRPREFGEDKGEVDERNEREMLTLSSSS